MKDNIKNEENKFGRIQGNIDKANQYTTLHAFFLNATLL